MSKDFGQEMPFSNKEDLEAFFKHAGQPPVLPPHLLQVKAFFKKNGPSSASFFVYFCLFKQTLPLLQQINVKKLPSRIPCWDSNSRPLEHKSPPITTRPVLPPFKGFFCKQNWPHKCLENRPVSMIHALVNLLKVPFQMFHVSGFSMS